VIAGWLAGKASGIIIFCIACLSIILLPVAVIQTVRINGFAPFGWFTVFEGYKPKLELTLKENATLRSNNAALDNGLKTCNASVDGIAIAGKALTDATNTIVAQKKRERAQLASNIAAMKGVKSSNEKCPVADSIITRGFQ
jgi:hypothetical protein